VKSSFSDFFSFVEQLSPESRETLNRFCTSLDIKPGYVISQQEDPSDAAYVVERGVLEVVSESPDRTEQRLIAYMSRGDLFGELGVLTGRPRSASVKAVDDVRVLKIEARDFLHLLHKLEGFGAYIATSVADRMHRATTRAVESSYCVDLGGNLSNFDLLIVFQTVNSSGRTGELRLYTPSNELVGNFFFRHGRIDYAQYGHITGIEALWQVLCEVHVLGTFQFQISDHPTLPVDVDRKIAQPCSDLLMQAASKRDQLMTFPEDYRNLSRKVERASEVWSPEGLTNPEIDHDIWKATANLPQPLSLLWRKFSDSSLTLLQNIAEMERAGLVRYV
jgi:CRP-like cAMP-binding protein